MGIRKGVTIQIDENFFTDVFEKERRKEQDKLRRRTGSMFNLTQRNFTAILHAKRVKFTFPKQKFLPSSRPIRRKKR